MNITVDFNSYSFFVAVKIKNENMRRMLPSKF